MSWEFQSGMNGFEKARRDWDSLNRSCGNHILLDSAFVAALLRWFPNKHVKLGIDNGPNRGMLLLLQRRPGFWETFQPSQAPIGLILLEHSDSRVARLREITRKLPGYALQLSILQQDPDHTSLSVDEVESGLERIEYIRTARITLNGTFDEYWQKRGTKMRYNVNSRRRRAAQKGHTLELVTLRAERDVPDAIREFGRLESCGWKGRDGTAVTADNNQGRFYREVFEYFCARGEGVVYQLKMDGTVVASDLCLVRGGMMVLLKTSYDEQLDEFSPAFLMREDILRRLYAERQIRTVEFYGRAMEWHTRWSEEIRTMFHLNFLRHSWIKTLKKLRNRAA